MILKSHAITSCRRQGHRAVRSNPGTAFYLTLNSSVGCAQSCWPEGFKTRGNRLRKLVVSPSHFSISVLMNPTRLLSRALLSLSRVLCFPFLVRPTGEDNLGGSTPQYNSQVQVLHSARVPVGSGGPDVEEYSSESTVGNKPECVLITRKFPTARWSDR